LKKITSWLRLLRPANIITSVADVMAGIAIAGYFSNGSINAAYLLPVLLLGLSTACLYGGGIVFNDVFDAGLDSVERPERPIPSGQVALRHAILLGSILLLAGIALASLAGAVPGALALAISIAALVYNKFSKHHGFIGPLNMGICRGLNLLLGISILVPALQHWYPLAIVPVVYIFSITMISQGEVHGGNRTKLYTAAGLYTAVAAAILYFAYRNDTLVWTILFLFPFSWMIFTPLITAIQQPVGKNIGKAVKAGVLSLILMDAAWAACFHAPLAAACIVCLLPLSLWLGKRFAVT
jgi:UbiA prenyltransferase family